MTASSTLTPAPLTRRSLAACVDGLPLLLVGVASLVILYNSRGPGGAPRDEVVAGLGGLIMLVATLWMGYMTLSTWRGRPLGKRLLGLRVVTVDGERPGLGAVFAREGIVKVIAPVTICGLILPAAIPLIPAFLAVPMLWNRSRRLAAQDAITGTMVVVDRAAAAA